MPCVLSSHETAPHCAPCRLRSVFLHYQLEGRLGFAGIVVHASFMLADCVQGMGRSVAPTVIKMCDWVLGSAYESQQIFFIVLR